MRNNICTICSPEFRITTYILQYFAKFVHLLRQGPSDTSEQEEQYNKYSEKLRQIVKSLIHLDFENTLQDNFSDMKQDI